MKKFLCLIMSVLMFVSASAINTFAMQDDVKAAYKNELQWLGKNGKYCSWLDYCTYDINKDGYKELIVKIGGAEADTKIKFYSCSYGKIKFLGECGGFHSYPYECNGNGIFIFGGYMGGEWLYRISKEGNGIKSKTIFDRDVSYLLDQGYSDPYHPPKYELKLYRYNDYSGLY